MSGTYYKVLGVRPSASGEQISAAYRDLAKSFHPDMFASASVPVRNHADRTMAEINEAYHTLKDPGRRAAYDQARGSRLWPDSEDDRPDTPRQRDEPPRQRPPNDRECSLCGSGPAASVAISRQVGLLLARRSFRLEEPLCRNCGLALVRNWTARTIWTGWWGIISVFANVGALVTNFNSWQSIRQLPKPGPRAAGVVAPIPRPMDVGKPLWQRPSVLGFVAIVAVLAASGNTAATQSTSPAPTFGTGPAMGADDFNPRDLEGSCVQVGGDGYLEDIVPCYDLNDGRIVAVTRSASTCPRYAEWYFEVDDTTVLCVDT